MPQNLTATTTHNSSSSSSRSFHSVTNMAGRGGRERLALPKNNGHRKLSTTTAKPASEPAPVRDFFLDNLGKVFLGAIAMVIATLVRSSYGGSNMKAVKEALEEDAAIDPLELDELRQANSELTPAVFRAVMKDIYSHSSAASGRMLYEDFVKIVRTTLIREKGEGCTIGMGHLLDRVVIATLQDKLKKQQQQNDAAKNSTLSVPESSNVNRTEPASFSTTDTSSSDNDATMPISFWLTVLSMALNGPVDDRIQILYEVLEQQAAVMDASSNKNNASQQQFDLSIDSSSDSTQSKESKAGVTLQDVITMVDHLQQSCQLSPDTQVVPTETKYPIQQYRRGTPEELVQWQATDGDNSQGGKVERLDADAFAGILRTKSVCAWGECYRRKK